MAVTIRNGTEKDFPAVMNLINKLAEFEKASDKVRNSEEQMKRERDFFRFFVAEDEGKIIGHAVYYFAYYTWVGKSIYVDDLYVEPEYRRKKIGSMLLHEVFKQAEREGCKRVRWQVLDWNENAIKFYSKLGASISKEWLNCDFDEKGIEKFVEKSADPIS